MKRINMTTTSATLLALTLAIPATRADHRVPPAIADRAPDDADRNRIADSLDEALAQWPPGEPVPVIVTLTERPALGDIEAFLAQGGSIAHVYRYATYGFSGEIDPGRVPALADALAGPLQVIRLDQNGVQSLDLSTAQARVRDDDNGDNDDAFVWEYGYTGDSECSVAIAGSGISVTHDDLGDSPDDDIAGDPDDWGNFNDPTHVIVGWHDSTIEQHANPWDINGHETLVAGIVAGRGNVDPAFMGIAPDTRLVGLKFGYVDGGNSFFYDSDFLAVADWVLAGEDFVLGAEMTAFIDYDGDGDLVDECDFGGFSAPTFGDLDGDGDLDMLVGSGGAEVSGVRNVGSASDPLWQHDDVFSSGLPAVNPWSVPALADVDGDGDLDLLVGQDNGGSGDVFAWKNTGSTSSPSWSINTSWILFNADSGGRPAPALGDLDGDGDPDALVGRADGSIEGYVNNGGATFGYTSSFTSGLNHGGTHAQPALADMDGDGDLDLVVGFTGGAVIAYRNTGSTSSPTWTRDDTLVAGVLPARGGGYAAPALADLDNDGDHDAVLGRADGILIGYRKDAGGILNRDRFDIKVFNLSTNWGASAYCYDVIDAVNALVANGIVVTCSAGNGHDNGPGNDHYYVSYPARSPKVITVGATTTYYDAANDRDVIAGYSANGDPSDPIIKPDLVAPGGGHFLQGGTIRGAAVNPSDGYRNDWGTSFAAPHVAGAAALLIQAQEANGDTWSYTEAEVMKIKAVLQMTATETIDAGENPDDDPQEPTTDRGGKDRVEGYGRMNADAAVEAETMTWDGSTAQATLEADARGKNCWARRITLQAGALSRTINLAVPDGADFDLYLYEFAPVNDGEPVIFRSSTTASTIDDENDESLSANVENDATYYVVVKRVEGSGTFTLTIDVDTATYEENFDAYDPGPLSAQSDWEPWNGDPGADEFIVTDEAAHSEPHSVEIDGPDDAVNRLDGFTEGRWTFTTRLLVPQELNELQSFILLNTYPAGPSSDWSLQLEIDGGANMLADRNSSAALPLVRGVWTEVRVDIDLDADEQTVFYDGRHLVTKSWTAGVQEGGALNIGAVNLYAVGSSVPVYYDDMELTASTEPECPHDLDGSGAVDFGDILRILGTWGQSGGPEDLDGSGEVDFGDLIEILANWGDCP